MKRILLPLCLSLFSLPLPAGAFLYYTGFLNRLLRPRWAEKQVAQAVIEPR